MSVKRAEGKSNGANVGAEVDALFQLSPPDFVAARNALAARLKKEGRDEESRHVKALAKPSISAWTVNQLYWRHRGDFERMIATGERFRQAQTSRLAGGGGDIRALLNEQRDVLSGLARLAAAILQKASGVAPAGVMRRITASLEALSAYGSLPGAPPAGRLVDDVAPPGFDTLAALVPRVGDAPSGKISSRVLSFQKELAPAPTARKGARRDAGDSEQQRKARLAAAARAKDQAARALADAKKGALKAQATLKQAAARAKDTEKEMVVVEERLNKVASQAHEARQQARRAAVEAESAAQAVDEAERALKKATHDLNHL
jgi:hypothetical protein